MKWSRDTAAIGVECDKEAKHRCLPVIAIPLRRDIFEAAELQQALVPELMAFQVNGAKEW